LSARGRFTEGRAKPNRSPGPERVDRPRQVTANRAGQAAGDVVNGVDPDTLAWWLLSFLASHGFRTVVMPNRTRREADLARITLEMLAGSDG
jgi:hypothetical protein